jgi:hypothetical protein
MSQQEAYPGRIVLVVAPEQAQRCPPDGAGALWLVHGLLESGISALEDS